MTFPNRKQIGGTMTYLDHLEGIAHGDVLALNEAEKSYGDSWKKRGGVGAFMMLARKWDRIEKQVGQTLAHPPITDHRMGTTAVSPWDIFGHIKADSRPEGLLDDIRDLRRYLMLIEAEMVAQNVLAPTSLTTNLDPRLEICETQLQRLPCNDGSQGHLPIKRVTHTLNLLAQKWCNCNEAEFTHVPRPNPIVHGDYCEYRNIMSGSSEMSATRGLKRRPDGPQDPSLPCDPTNVPTEEQVDPTGCA